MNELLWFILITISLSFFAYSLSFVLMRKLRINHPKNRFVIYAIIMISILFISFFSFTALGTLQEKNQLEEFSVKNSEENASLLVIIDETKSKNNSSSTESVNQTDESNLYDKNETLQNVRFSLVNSVDDLKDIISQIKKGNLNFTLNISDNGVNSSEKNNITKSSCNKINNDPLKKSSLGFYFLMFNIILLIISVIYLLFCFLFGKIIILKNINARRCQDKKVLNLVRKVCKEIKIKTPEVFIFDGDPNAFVFGYPASLVVSKKLIDYLSSEELNVAIRHELAHISNKDHILKPLLQTFRILFFYNPVVHIVYNKIIKERELLADSKFISSKSEKIKFMELLFKIDDFHRKKDFFSKKLFKLGWLSLSSHKIRKLKITDRFNNLFSCSKKKTFITALISLIVLFLNFSIVPVGFNIFSDDVAEINDNYEPKNSNDDLCEDYNEAGLDNGNIYILRLIKKNPKSIDFILIEETF